MLRPRLESALRDIPDDRDLADATAEEIAAVARLFEPLDEKDWLGVRGTTLSKVMHRKRPRLIPLHDQHVHSAYVPRVGADRGRSWASYMEALMIEMRADLSNVTASWSGLAKLPPTGDPVLTHLRILDILAWWHGNPRTKIDSSATSE